MCGTWTDTYILGHTRTPGLVAAPAAAAEEYLERLVQVRTRATACNTHGGGHEGDSVCAHQGKPQRKSVLLQDLAQLKTRSALELRPKEAFS